MKLIDKSAVEAEIKRIMAEEMSFFKDCCKDGLENTSSPVVYTRMEMLLSFIDTLEVKDVDEIIKTAEDHAYFAGSENTREKLIDKACKWWEDELSYPSMTPEEIKWYKNKVRKFRKAMEDEK